MDCLEHQASISLCSDIFAIQLLVQDSASSFTLTESLSLLHMQSPVKCQMKLIGLVHQIASHMFVGE